MESPNSFSQTLKADLNDVEFPWDSTLIQYKNYFFYALGHIKLSREHNLPITIVAIKGHKFSNGELWFAYPK